MQKTIFFTVFLMPLLASAQASGSSPISDTLMRINDLVRYLIPLMLSLAVLMFLWGIVKFIANIGDEESRKAGKSLMVWGMIALFVMISFWGIINYVATSVLGTLSGPTVVPAPTMQNIVVQ